MVELILLLDQMVEIVDPDDAEHVKVVFGNRKNGNLEFDIFFDDVVKKKYGKKFGVYE